MYGRNKGEMQIVVIAVRQAMQAGRAEMARNCWEDVERTPALMHSVNVPLFARESAPV